MKQKFKSSLIGSMLLLCLGGCASVPESTPPQDPWERYNRGMSKFNDKIDRYVLKPVAKGYDKIMPAPVDKGVTNFFSNLGDVVVLANDLLQLKFQQASDDFSRVVYNTLFGLGGVLDVAGELGFEKHDEDFGQTLGYWGVGPGPYFVIPVLGPSTVRDSFGLLTDIYVFDPVTTQVDNLYVVWELYALQLVDIRSDLLPAGDIIDKASGDPYVFLREAYLQRRDSKVHDGAAPEQDIFEDLQ